MNFIDFGPNFLNPCCWFGYGQCEPNLVVTTEPISATPVAAEVVDDSSLPFRVKLIGGDINAAFNLQVLGCIALAAFVGAISSSFVLYLFWRKYLPQRSPIIPESLQEDATTGANSDPDEPAHRPKKSPDEDFCLLDLIGNPELVRNAYFALNPGCRRPRLFSRIFGQSRKSDITIPEIPDISKTTQCNLFEEALSLLPNTRTFASKAVQTGCDLVIEISHGPTLELHQYPRGARIPCENPLGMKLECLLRLFKIPFSVVFDCGSADVNRPWLILRDPSSHSGGQDDESGSRIDGNGNSESLVEFLHDNFPDSRHVLKLGQVEVKKTIPTHFIMTLVQFHLIPIFCRWRELELSSNSNSIPIFQFKSISVSVLDEKPTNTSATNNAIHQMSQTELKTALQSDLSALSVSLDSKLYFIGDRISTVDCTVFAVLCQMTWDKPGCMVQQLIYRFSNLVKHCLNIKSILWPDWESQLKTQPAFRQELSSLFPTMDDLDESGKTDESTGVDVDSSSKLNQASIIRARMEKDGQSCRSEVAGEVDLLTSLHALYGSNRRVNEPLQ